MKLISKLAIVTGLVLLMATTARTQTFNFTVNTSSLPAEGWRFVAFGLINGDGVVNNTVTISEFQNQGGGIMGYPDCTNWGMLNGSGCTGNLETSVTLSDVEFANIFKEYVGIGTSMTFRVTMSHSYSGFGTPDTFAIYICSADTGICYSDDQLTGALITTEIPDSTPLHATDFVFNEARDYAMPAPQIESDMIPPVLTMADVTVDATTPAGALVNLNVTALDDVDGPRPVTCSATQVGASQFAGVGPVQFSIGKTVVSCTASDTSNNESMGSFTVIVRAASEQVKALITTVSQLNLKQGVVGSFDAKLDAAYAALAAANAGQRNNVCNLMSAFVNEVNAQCGMENDVCTKAMATPDAMALSSAAIRISKVLGCP